MAVRTDRTGFGGGTDFENNKPFDVANDLVDTFDAVINRLVPIGSIIPWAKTFNSVDSGTTSGTTANKLVDAGQNFQTTVSVGNLVHNTTDNTFAYVTAVDSDTQLSLDADIMTSGEAFTIYTTPALPDGWVECDGSAISDADSPFNGANAPDLNNPADTGLRGYFLRGHTESGLTQTDQNKEHTHTADVFLSSNGNGFAGFNNNQDGTAETDPSGGDEARPHNYSVVFIFRIK